MKKIFRILLYLIGIVLILGTCGVIYLKTAFPKVDPPTDLKVELTPERVERGRYLANHVMLCMDCHGKRDWTLFSGPPQPGTLGGGGDRFDHSVGFPGVFYARNITPKGIGSWTDGEIYRLLTTGVTRNDEVIFPVMPYGNYAKCDPEDIKSVIAYLRTIQPIENTNNPSKADFPLNLILPTMAVKPEPNTIPNKNDLQAYGKYVATAASCNECHTAVDDKGKHIGAPFSGGRTFHFPDGTILRSANITPHPATGIGNWTEEYFLNKFKMHADSATNAQKLKPGDFQSIMPWTMYAGMDSLDLRAIYAFLKSLPPVDNPVVKVTAPTAK